MNCWSLVRREKLEKQNQVNKIYNIPVEGAAKEVERLARATSALLAGAESSEVLGSLGSDIGAELRAGTKKKETRCIISGG